MKYVDATKSSVIPSMELQGAVEISGIKITGTK